MRRSREALRLWTVLARAYRTVEAHAAADTARHGLTLAEFGVLEALYRKGPLVLGALQRSVLVSSGGITYLVNRLERRGLVRREPCPEDGRARYAVLTASGARLMDGALPEHASAIVDGVAGLTWGEQRIATRLLRSLGVHAGSDHPGRNAGAPHDAVAAPSGRNRAAIRR